ncbi:MAG: insulinase family protein, partial [Planctomycetota bacterium]
VKRTDFKEQQILMSARLGEGELSLDPARAVVNFVGQQVFNGAGLAAHSEDDLRRLTAGKLVGVSFGVGEDAFQLGGGTTREDLLFQLELLCAYLEAPGWRADGLVQFRRGLPLTFEGLAHQHQGPVAQHFFPALFDNDPRNSLPTEEAAAAIEMDDVRAWLAPVLAEGALELTLVGDLDLEETITLAARTLGRLPARRAWQPFDERRNVPVPKSGLRQTHTIDTEVPKSLVLIVFPIPDGLETRARRYGGLLGTVVNDRLRVEVREKLGAAYSPGAGTQQSTVYPGSGLLLIQAMADPDKVETLVEACLGVARSLSESGVTDEEIARLKEPLLKGRRDAKRQNGFWLSVLSETDRKPRQLDDLRSADAFYEGFTAADLTPFAREYLQPERASILVVNPE